MADPAHEPSVVPFAILGMCGYLAGVTQAPLTSLVIVMEMTTQHAMVLPLMDLRRPPSPRPHRSC